MGGIVIKRNGVNHLDLVERGHRTIVSASQRKVLLSDDSVTVRVNSNSPLGVKINDTFEVYGDVYRINQLPSVTKNNESSYDYEIIGQGLMYDLLRCKFFNADGEGFKTTTSFSLVGQIEVFLIAIANNMQRFSALWEVGNFTNGETKTITFSDDSCLSALQKICQEFDTEFWITNNTGKFKINVGEFGSTLPVTLQYGKGKGLYNLSRRNVNDDGVISRLYVSGGTENIPTDYREYSDRLKFSDAGYLEDAALISTLGLKEGSLILDDIYPKRTGVISAIGNTVYKFSDSGMDFDLNEKDSEGNTKYLIDGQTAKMHFNKGNLAGYQFEIKSYNHTTKEFEIIPFDNGNGQVFPDEDAEVFQFEVGDEYVLLDIVMPQTYITNAETELQTKGAEQFEILKQIKVSYDLNVAEDFLRTLPNNIQIGDLIRVVDSALNVDKTLRVHEVTRDFIQGGVVNDFAYKVVIADGYEISIASQIILDITDIRTVITNTKIDNLRLSRIGLRITEELRDAVFDTDGYFDMDNIKPLSIETSMLSVGSRSQQVSTNLVFLTNIDANPNKIGGAASVLYSQTLDKQWNISAFNMTLPDNNMRYVYAKVRKEGLLTGLIEVSTEQKQYEADPTFYYILLGMLSSVIEGARVFVPTIGSTTINGGLIRTGIISSLDGQTFFNLNTGQIKGRIEFTNDSPAFQQILENIKIGSRNYALGTAESKNRANAGFLSYPISDDFATDDYVVSFDYECTAVYSIGISLGTVNFYDGDYEINAVLQPTENHFVGTANFVRDGSDTHIVIYVNEQTTISNFKIEKGTIATDWTPAPEDIEADISNIENQLQGVNNLLTDIADDNKLTPSEKHQLKQQYDIIVAEKAGTISQAQTYGVPTANYENQHTALVNFLNPLLANMNTTSTVNGNYLRSLFTSYYNQKIALLTDVTNAINDDLSAISQEINTLRNDLTDEINDVSDSITNLNQYVDGAFSDGIISEAEAVAIEKHLNQLNVEKADIDAKYVVVYNNEFLVAGTSKTELLSAYGSTATSGYRGAHKNLIDAINAAIADGKTTPTEKANVDSKFTLYRNALSLLSQKFENALKTIEAERIKAVQIGGRNLLRNSDFKGSIAYWYANGSGETLQHWSDNGNGCLWINNGGLQGATFHVLSKAVEGKHMASFDVKPLMQMGSAPYLVRILAMNTYVDIPIHSISEWKRYSVPIEGTSSIYFTIQVLGNQTLIFDNVKFERGTIATDWTPMVEEVDEQVALAVAQAQNAINTANAAAAVTNFLQTTIDGNVVSTGTLQVGNLLGANAGISGVTDMASRSVRFWAGGTYAQKNTSRWNVDDDGVERTFHPNGQLATIRGIVDGKYTYDWYHQDGYLLFKLDPNRGLVNVAYTNESWTQKFFRRFTITNENATDEELRDAIQLIVTQTNGVYQILPNKLTYQVWEYFNGTNPANAQYEVHNGYKTANNSRTSNIPNGWYITHSGVLFKDYLTDKPVATAVFIQNGVEKHARNVILTGI